jgi:hypothetical protein
VHPAGRFQSGFIGPEVVPSQSPSITSRSARHSKGPFGGEKPCESVFEAPVVPAPRSEGAGIPLQASAVPCLADWRTE